MTLHLQQTHRPTLPKPVLDRIQPCPLGDAELQAQHLGQHIHAAREIRQVPADDVVDRRGVGLERAQPELEELLRVVEVRSRRCGREDAAAAVAAGPWGQGARAGAVDRVGRCGLGGIVLISWYWREGARESWAGWCY